MAMEEFFARPLARAALLFAAIAALMALGAFIVARFRGGAEDDQLAASQLLSKFRELHEQGQLSDEEFRKIKAKLRDRLETELNDSGGKG